MDTTISATFAHLLDAAGGDFDTQLSSFFEPDERLTFEVRLPEGADGAPPGMFIYISPKPGAAVPPGWGRVLDQHNLAWAGALDSGNEVHVARAASVCRFSPNRSLAAPARLIPGASTSEDSRAVAASPA